MQSDQDFSRLHMLAVDVILFKASIRNQKPYSNGLKQKNIYYKLNYPFVPVVQIKATSVMTQGYSL